ncbi:uncharacterized protein LOC110605690 isoform X2 [Manihot esculenta]|uniref:Uncharacterized protein n=1 Tax=Manihot esculenta TaxID=3983 RepID=A0A2C9U533_MANES|nr:uncharacterized protein LOC110605690 isoform X2 [Manihot esculenta]OAY24854.1 hypothetical protein MANES_17G048900v8 [Manihot esculenta]
MATTEENETFNGWPLGLEIMTGRLRVMESIQAAPAEPYSNTHLRSPSFSSFTSSNFDTESTASFFQDRSVSLGRLIGIRPGKGNGDFYFPSREGKSVRAVSCEVSRGHRPEMSQGNCIPLLVGTLEKMSRSKSMKFNGYKH